MSGLQYDLETADHSSGKGIVSPSLLKFPELRHVSTTRNYAGPDTPRVQELIAIRSLLGFPESSIVFAEQKHTNHITVVTQDLIDAGNPQGYSCAANTDALICSSKNVTIAIQTADCAPIFLYDPIAKIIALVHAGWKGTLSRITQKTVQKMCGLSSRPGNIVAWIGPMAGVCCYEVSEELVESFLGEFKDIPAAEIHRERHLDLVSINCHQLKQAGVLSENIHRSNVCTIHNTDRFYSYRASQGTTGRIISAMVMTGNP